MHENKLRETITLISTHNYYNASGMLVKQTSLIILPFIFPCHIMSVQMAEYDENGYIVKLDENEIFVFGSNGGGAHLAGAAATAVRNFGAIMGQAEGLQGQSYAIDTMDGESEMFAQIKRFLQFAKEHQELKFLVTEIGCGIAGYIPEEIAPGFKNHSKNVVLPESFNKVLD